MAESASPQGTEETPPDLYSQYLQQGLEKFGDQPADSQEQPIVDEAPQEEDPSDDEATEEDLDEEITDEDVEAEDDTGETEEPDNDEIELPESLAAEYRDRIKKLPREGQEVALDLYQSFQRGFTQKTTELANIRKEYEAANQQAAQGNEILLQKIQILDGALKARVPARPDRSLLDTNPQLYHKQNAEYAEHQEQLKALETERAQAIQKAQADQQQAIVQTATVAFEQSRQKIPGWRDVETAKKEGKELVDYIKGKGVGQESIIELAVNPTLQELAWKAMRYERLMNKKRDVNQKTSNKPPVRNLKSSTPTKVSTKTKSAQRFEKTGNPQDLEAKYYEEALRKFR